MNSIYKQLNKIDDSKSLNEKWNVKNQLELNNLIRTHRLNESWDNDEISGSIEYIYDRESADDYASYITDKLHNMGMPIEVEKSRWYGENEIYEEILADIKTEISSITDDTVDEIVRRIYKKYTEWLENPEVKQQVKELRNNKYFQRGEDWYGDSGAASTDGWPDDSNMSEDPDYIQAIIEWWPGSMYFWDDISGDELKSWISTRFEWWLDDNEDNTDATVEDAIEYVLDKLSDNDEGYEYDEDEAIEIVKELYSNPDQLDEALEKEKAPRSLGYAYTLNDIRKNALKIAKESNVHIQSRKLKDLTTGCRLTIHEVDDLISRLSTYSDALHTFVNSTRSAADAEQLANSITGLSI